MGNRRKGTALLHDRLWEVRERERHYLFVCSQNKLRSPTAEQIFADHPGIETRSAGTNHDAETPLDDEMLRWADTIFVMEKTHRARIQQRFRSALGSTRIICLDIPDDYAFMDADLIALLHTRMTRFLPR